MLKKLSRTTSFILIGIVVGLFVGVSIRQALGDTTDVPGTVRADNLTVNTSGQYTNGLIVANGNALVSGNVGIGTITPTVKLDVVGDISVSANGKAIGIKVWSGNLVVLDKVGIGVTNPVEKLDVQGNIRSAGYVKADSLCIGNVDGACVGNYKKLCIGSTCIDETQLKEMLNGENSGGGVGGKVTPGTMTGTGISSDPYLCPTAYVAGVQSPSDCKNDSSIKQSCCASGVITSCKGVAGGSSLVGSGCTYTPPREPEFGTMGSPIDEGIQWFSINNPMAAGYNYKYPQQVGGACVFPSDWIYEKAPYYDENGNEIPEAGSATKISKAVCTEHGFGNDMYCYRAHRWRQTCSQ